MSEVSSGMSTGGLGPEAANVNPPPRTAGQRIILGVVIGLGVLIFLGLGALGVGIAMKMRGGGSPSAAAASALALPAGASIEAMQVSGDRLILRVKTPQGEEIDIVDTTDGHVVSRIKAAAPEVPH